jgi:hypothetical protein
MVQAPNSASHRRACCRSAAVTASRTESSSGVPLIAHRGLDEGEILRSAIEFIAATVHGYGVQRWGFSPITSRFRFGGAVPAQPAWAGPCAQAAPQSRSTATNVKLAPTPKPRMHHPRRVHHSPILNTTSPHRPRASDRSADRRLSAVRSSPTMPGDHPSGL